MTTNLRSFDLVKLDRYFSDDQKKRIDELLYKWHTASSIGKIITKNIENEFFLSYFPELTNILEFILNEFPLNCTDTEILIFEDKYKRFCTNFLLKGGKVELTPFPKYLGRVVEASVFKLYIKDNYSHIIAEPDDFIQRLIDNSRITSEEKNILISIFNIWVTWNENNSKQKPFEFIKFNKADEVRANLGLMKRKGRLLLFIYKKSNSLELYRPTIADAGLYYYFDTTIRKGISPDENKFGYTKTWAKEGKIKKFSIKPRPEAIHKPKVKIKFIELPLKDLY